MRWNTVLFDLDGTVTDPKEGITCAVAYALRQQGIIADPDTLTSFIGPPLHESFPELFGLTEEQAMRRIQSQMPLCEKEKLADRTISTDCPLEELRARMGRLYRQWLEEAQA